jgi:AraC-like DNA-binding protein
VKHRIEASDTEDPISYYALLLEVDEEDGELRSLLEQELNWQRCYRIGNTYRFFFEELREKALSTADYMQMSAVHQLVSFIYLLMGGDGNLRQGNTENIHIEKALMYMQNSVFKRTNLTNLARRLRISEEHLIRLFRQKLTTTPMKYLTKLRIEAATSMLISSDMYVYQIAERLQFNSEFHFSRVFKKYTGRSPKHYRNLYRQLIGQSPEHESILYINTQ